MGLLALSACAVLACATSVLAIGEWIADASPQVLERLGARYDPLARRHRVPDEATVRRVLTRIDGARSTVRWAGGWVTAQR